MMSDSIPLEELTRYWTASNAKEMARRLRALDEEIREVAEVEHGHGIRRPFIFTERVRAILDGRE